jgi:hypothetical protein
MIKVRVNNVEYTVNIASGAATGSCAAGSISGVTLMQGTSYAAATPETIKLVFDEWWKSMIAAGLYRVPYVVVAVVDYGKGGDTPGAVVTGDFIEWIIERKIGAFVASPIFSNPNYTNGHICVAGVWLPPFIFDRMVDGTGGVYNLPEQFEKKIWNTHTTLKGKKWEDIVTPSFALAGAKHFAYARTLWEENLSKIEAKMKEPVVWKTKK